MLIVKILFSSFATIVRKITVMTVPLVLRVQVVMNLHVKAAQTGVMDVTRLGVKAAPICLDVLSVRRQSAQSVLFIKNLI